MFLLKTTKRFDRDFKLIKRRSSKETELVSNFLKELEINGVEGIDQKYLSHKLKGNYQGNWEAHIKPDLLIIRFEIKADNEILLVRLGSHSDLFN